MPTIEHKIAKMDGGTDRIGNLAAACLHCNRNRGRQMNMSRIAARKTFAEGASGSGQTA
jgi:HNH endonuclease